MWSVDVAFTVLANHPVTPPTAFQITFTITVLANGGWHRRGLVPVGEGQWGGVIYQLWWHPHGLWQVMASYSLQTTGSRLLWAARVHYHDDSEKLWNRSTYSIATACPLCSWLIFSWQFFPDSCYPYVVTNVAATHTQFNQDVRQLHNQRKFPLWIICVSL